MQLGAYKHRLSNHKVPERMHNNCKAIYIAAGATAGALFKDARCIAHLTSFSFFFLFLFYRDASDQEYRDVRPSEKIEARGNRDAQTVGADGLWRFRMRIYVPRRDVNNAREAAINSRGPHVVGYLGLGNCRLLCFIAEVICYYHYARHYVL